MKSSTIKKYIGILRNAQKSGKKLSSYCLDNGISYKNLSRRISELKKQDITKEIETLLDLFDITKKGSDTSIIRDDDGRIQYYSYQIYRSGKAPLCGKFSREEMNTIHRLYSYYGDSLTQRIVSRHFVDLSLVDFKRILNAFKITKATAPFALHMFEEYSEEELREIQLREKENSFLRKAEEDAIKNNELLLKKYALENIELKKQINELSNLSITIPENIKPIKLPHIKVSDRSINLYIADMHLGAAVTTGALYPENINYGFDEAKRRLEEVLTQVYSFGTFDNINVVLLGDNIDCCGVYGKTARMTHDIPENMDVREQANSFIEIILWFISSLVNNKLCNNIRVFSVPCGNHGGNYEYVCNKAVLSAINALFPEIETTLWEEFFGIFEDSGHTFICTHGKESEYMRKGLPLILDDKSKVMLYEWLYENGIDGDNIHFIKGDLHSNSISSCKRLDYRNVLSLFGASDHSNYNFSKNSYGLSYDIIDRGNLLRGNFENV